MGDVARVFPTYVIHLTFLHITFSVYSYTAPISKNQICYKVFSDFLKCFYLKQSH